jgi:hemerythrin superfamily protein
VSLDSIAHRRVAELGGPTSVLVRQREEHVRLNALLEDLGRTAGDAQELVLQRIHRLVFPHAFAEESVLWPALRQVLPDGEALTLEVEREHQEVNALVARLERLDRAAPERAEVLDRLVEVLREDVRDEEDVLFPRLLAGVPARELRRLGARWEVVRRIAPTRAHPVVARRPPGNVIAAVPLTVIDRLRDAVDDVGLRSPAGRVLRPVGAGLTVAAHAVERLPWMRSGEDPSTRVPRTRGGRSSAVALAVGLLAFGAAAAALRRRAA